MRRKACDSGKGKLCDRKRVVFKEGAAQQGAYVASVRLFGRKAVKLRACAGLKGKLFFMKRVLHGEESRAYVGRKRKTAVRQVCAMREGKLRVYRHVFSAGNRDQKSMCAPARENVESMCAPVGS